MSLLEAVVSSCRPGDSLFSGTCELRAALAGTLWDICCIREIARNTGRQNNLEKLNVDTKILRGPDAHSPLRYDLVGLIWAPLPGIVLPLDPQP